MDCHPSHTLNTICLSGYLLHYVISCHENIDASHQVAGFTFACLFVGLIGLGRVYLGMHSVIDILGGLVLGLTILAFWLNVHEYIDTFVTSFWVALAFCYSLATRTPESPIQVLNVTPLSLAFWHWNCRMVLILGSPHPSPQGSAVKALAKWITTHNLQVNLGISGKITPGRSRLCLIPAFVCCNMTVCWSVVDLVPSLFSQLERVIIMINR
ncbi:hypothetical protein Tco_0051238 [Tanacetum coccineum]|uniref:Lipid phosphate phosphatase delta-like protein n=1 Tax=Tanacetum coccineum TaxID=301880 RepID=A0ABQ4Z568_9ASTR